MVCLAGSFGWWVSRGTRDAHHRDSSGTEGAAHDTTNLDFNVLGQIFGYLCAIFYLGSRIPQILLNHRRKSTEGVSMLFFLFACVGNLTYVLSIMAYEPSCRRQHHRGSHDGSRVSCDAGEIYAQYILINASWLLGSLGTLLLDLAIFAQFFLYRRAEADGSS